MNEVAKLFNNRSKNYDEIYRGIDSKRLLHQEKRVRAAVIEDIIINDIDLSDNRTILDIGCGTGNFLLRLRDKGIKSPMVGLDISDEMIEKAKENLQNSEHTDLSFNTGSTKEINHSAGLVLSIGVSGYLENENRFIEELANLVDEDGVLIITTANGNSILRKLRHLLSTLHSLIKNKTKSRGIKFRAIKEKTVDEIILDKEFNLEKRVYITFGIGLFESSFECSLDRLMFRTLKNNFLCKFLSLTTIHVFRKVA